MKKILVAMDGSKESFRAAQLGAELAGGVGARLVLAHVIRPAAELAGEHYSPDIQSWDRAQEQEAIEFLGKAEQFAGMRAERLILRGAPAEEIARFAEAPDIELVLVGSRGRGAVARLLLGSVSDRLVHICSKPVLVAR